MGCHGPETNGNRTPARRCTCGWSRGSSCSSGQLSNANGSAKPVHAEVRRCKPVPVLPRFPQSLPTDDVMSPVDQTVRCMDASESVLLFGSRCMYSKSPFSIQPRIFHFATFVHTFCGYSLCRVRCTASHVGRFQSANAS